VQGLCGILGYEWADFVVWTPTEMQVQRVPFDLSYWQTQLLPSLRDFYRSHHSPRHTNPAHPRTNARAPTHTRTHARAPTHTRTRKRDRTLSRYAGVPRTAHLRMHVHVHARAMLYQMHLIHSTCMCVRCSSTLKPRARRSAPPQSARALCLNRRTRALLNTCRNRSGTGDLFLPACVEIKK
jgi:hypothetical protein